MKNILSKKIKKENSLDSGKYIEGPILSNLSKMTSQSILTKILGPLKMHYSDVKSTDFHEKNKNFVQKCLEVEKNAQKEVEKKVAPSGSRTKITCIVTYIATQLDHRHLL